MTQGNPEHDISTESDVDAANETNVHTAITSLDLIDHHNVDWKRVQRTAYLVHQHLRYDYPGPIDDLHQTLMLVPPEQHGDQRRIVYRVEVSAAHFEMQSRQDQFGNLVLTPFVPHIEQSIDFEAWIVVERALNTEPYYLSASCLTDPRYLDASTLTQPDEVLREVATKLRQEMQGQSTEQLARRINEWTYHALHYEHGVTHIHTTAAEALAHGKGVCQDFAHIMIAICRLCHLPARYVSGHMLGEGGTHAWVEVMLPSSEQGDEAVVIPLDPTHNRETSLSYITIAVGRDYLDVAPTSGTYRAAYTGQLSAYKRVGLTSLEYAEK